MNQSADPWMLKRRSRWLPLALAFLVSTVTAIVVFHVDSIEHERRLQEARASLAAQLAIVRAKLEFSLNEPLSRARGVIAQIVAHDGITPEEFDLIAQVLLKDQNGVRNMAVSRGMIIAMTYPLAGNESVVGVDFRSVPVQYNSVLQAIESKAPLLQGPVPLIQGGLGLILRNPVFLQDGSFYGMANMVLDISAVFAQAGLAKDNLPFQAALRGRDGLGAAGAMIFGDETVFNSDPVLTQVQLAQGSWQMAAIPKNGWRNAGRVSTRVRVMEALSLIAMTAIAFGAAFHIIEQDKAKQELRDKTQDLKRSNTDLERFAYIASHDLQTPLRSVAGYSQLLARRYRGQLDQDADDFIEFIVQGVDRMSQLIQDLLNYAQMSNSAVPASPVDSGAALAQALNNLAAIIVESSAAVHQDDMPMVMAEHDKLVSLFQNLIENSIKYAHAERKPEIIISVQSDRPGWWVFCVADNGIGIAPEYSDRVFEVFQRLHILGDRSGTGIGLAVCRRIVQQLGGEIWVNSTPDHGAAFLFTLPQV